MIEGILLRVSRYLNEIKTEYILAERILCALNAERTELLLNDVPRQSFVNQNDMCVIRKGGYVVLDFGCELHGGAEITVHRCEGGFLRAVFGESVSEAMSRIGEKHATNDHSPRDIKVYAPEYSNIRAGRTGFRFLKLEAAWGDVCIRGIRAAYEHRDIPYRGKFESDDKQLNDIWKIGARTVFLNMQEYLWDGIKRDRLIWAGDMHAEVSCINAVFGEQKVVRDSLDFLCDTTPPDMWMNGIPSYTFWWLIIERDMYVYSGNANELIKKKKYICTAVKNIIKNLHMVKKEGFSGIDSDCDKRSTGKIKKYFVDWETNGKPESETGFYALLCMGLSAAETICSVLGENALASSCADGAFKIRQMNADMTENKQIAALLALSGLKDAKEINEKVLKKEPQEDISAFLGYYTLLARGMAGDTDGALYIAKKYWGAMVNLGATSFWEYFNIREAENAAPIDRMPRPGEKDIHGGGGSFCYCGLRRSLCHGWACGPTPFLSTCVLGVKPLKPGFKEVLIKPSFGSLKYVRGIYPTPLGDIVIEAENKNGDIKTDIKAPDKIKIISKQSR